MCHPRISKSYFVNVRQFLQLFVMYCIEPYNCIQGSVYSVNFAALEHEKKTLNVVCSNNVFVSMRT